MEYSCVFYGDLGGWSLNIDEAIDIERRREMTRRRLLISKLTLKRTNYVCTPYWQHYMNIPPHNRFQVRNTRWSGPNNAPGTLTCSYSTYARTRYGILSCRDILCQGRPMIELSRQGSCRIPRNAAAIALSGHGSMWQLQNVPHQTAIKHLYNQLRKKLYSVLRRNDLNERSVQDGAWVKSGVRQRIFVNTVVRGCTE